MRIRRMRCLMASTGRSAFRPAGAPGASRLMSRAASPPSTGPGSQRPCRLRAMTPPIAAELAHVAAIWLFTCLSWRLEEALKDDATWGIWSIRGRLLWYLHAVIDMTASADVLPGINGAAHGWLSELQ